MRLAALLISLALLPTLTAVAHADGDAKAARRHFDEGSTLYDLGRFREAAAEYEEAYKLKNDPALLFNIGQAYRGAKKYEDAITAYKSFLRRMPEAPNRQEVAGHIERLQRLLDESRAAQAPEVAAPAATSEPVPSQAIAATPPVERTPIYKKWWLWTVVGGVVVVGAAVALAVAYTTPKDAPAPANALSVTF